MMKPADAERLTGYRVGGISPFGQRKKMPAVLEEAALRESLVFLNGGRRGMQVEMDPREIIRVLAAKTAAIVG